MIRRHQGTTAGMPTGQMPLPGPRWRSGRLDWLEPGNNGACGISAALAVLSGRSLAVLAQVLLDLPHDAAGSGIVRRTRDYGFNGRPEPAASTTWRMLSTTCAGCS